MLFVIYTLCLYFIYIKSILKYGILCFLQVKLCISQSFLEVMVILFSSCNSSTSFSVIVDNRMKGKDIMEDDIVQVSDSFMSFYLIVRYMLR